jgi:hypothetical protein
MPSYHYIHFSACPLFHYQTRHCSPTNILCLQIIPYKHSTQEVHNLNNTKVTARLIIKQESILMEVLIIRHNNKIIDPYLETCET